MFDRTQIYNPEIPEEKYTVQTVRDSYKHNQLNWKATIFCCNCKSKIWVFQGFSKKKF